jgi:hypothetical protein
MYLVDNDTLYHRVSINVYYYVAAL